MVTVVLVHNKATGAHSGVPHLYGILLLNIIPKVHRIFRYCKVQEGARYYYLFGVFAKIYDSKADWSVIGVFVPTYSGEEFLIGTVLS